MHWYESEAYGGCHGNHQTLNFFGKHAILGQVFYPRPVLAFGYCRCLHVCVCVCLSVNHQLVRVVTHQPFKLEPPNLDQRCKRSWLRSLLFFWTIDLELQGQIELKCQNLPHFELVRAISHHQLKSVFQGVKPFLYSYKFLYFGEIPIISYIKLKFPIIPIKSGNLKKY